MPATNKIAVFFSNSYPGYPGQPGLYTTTRLEFNDPSGVITETVETLNRLKDQASNIEIRLVHTSGWRRRGLKILNRWLTYRTTKLKERALALTEATLYGYKPYSIGFVASVSASPFEPVKEHEVEKVLLKLSTGNDLSFAAPRHL